MDGQPNLRIPQCAALDFSNRSRARREQTSQDLAALRCSIQKWLRQKYNVDAELRRHQTQLHAIDELLRGVVNELSSRAVPNTGVQAGKVYDDCRKLAQAIVWLERLWEFIRSKFDQRIGDTPTATTLRAADEVVWSCYRQVMKELPPGHPAKLRALTPLAYFEPEYSPAAVQFDQQLPAGLRLRSGNPTLDRCLEKIPLPTIRLPPWCVSAPWGLVLIGHEVGHHVQHELGIVAQFADGLRAAVSEANLDEPSAILWTCWSEEIFADAFSVLAMGPAAVIAITELEWTDERSLAQRKVHYPAPAIRLALMTRLAERVGLGTSGLVPCEQLRNIVAGDPVTTKDWKAVDAVVDLVCAPLPDGLPALKDLCGFYAEKFAPREAVAIWAEGLRGIGSLDVERDTEDARHMASASMAAWLTLVAESQDDARRSQLAKLATSVPGAISQCAEQCVRAGAGAVIPAEAAREIASLLLDASAYENAGEPG